MTDLKETASVSTSGGERAPAVEGASSTKKAVGPKKEKSQKPSAPKTIASQKAPRAIAPPPAAATRKTYTDKERAQKLAQVEKLVSRGETVRNAVSQAGVSEQTYYHWKKMSAAGSAGDDLKDLVALEEENRRLKSLLAERLRKENAELKKKLGLG